MQNEILDNFEIHIKFLGTSTGINDMAFFEFF